MSLHARTRSLGGRTRRRTVIVTVIVMATVGVLLSGCAADSNSSSAGSGATLVAPDTSGDQVTVPSDSSSDPSVSSDNGSGDDSSPGGLTPGDMNDICAGGAVCDPSSTGPPYVPGGGLALPDGGDD
jgi:hypothetical protein